MASRSTTSEMRFAAAVPVPMKARVLVRVIKPAKDSSNGVLEVAEL